MSNHETPAMKKIKAVISSMKSLSNCVSVPAFTRDHPMHKLMLNTIAYQILYFLNRDVAVHGITNRNSATQISFAIILQINQLAEEDNRIKDLKVFYGEQEINFIEHMENFLLVSSELDESFR